MSAVSQSTRPAEPVRGARSACSVRPARVFVGLASSRLLLTLSRMPSRFPARWVWCAALIPVVLAVLLLATAGPAAAATVVAGTHPGTFGVPANTPSPNPWLSFFTPEDSHGMTPWQYDLSLDQGGLTDPGKAVAALFANLLWLVYRFLVLAVMWLLDFVLQFRQLDLLRAPAEGIATTIQSVTGQIPLVALLGTLSIVISGIWLFKGRHGAGFGEMVMTTLIVGLIGTGLAHPLDFVAGDHGALASARDGGIAVASQMVTGSTTVQTPEQLRAGIDAAFLDNLVRTPHQLINYGRVLDKASPGCVTGYDTAVKDTGVDARDAVSAACGDDVLDASNNPYSADLGVGVVGTAGVAILLVVLVLALALMVFTGWALWESVKFVLEMIRSILPGSGRVAMLASAALIAISVFGCMLTLMAVGLLIVVMKDTFTATAGGPPATIFLSIDLVLVCAIIAGLVAMSKAKKASQTVGERLGKSLSPGPVKAPGAGPIGAAVGVARQLAIPAMQLRQQAKLRGNLAPTGPTPGNVPATGPTGAGGQTGGASSSAGPAAPRRSGAATIGKTTVGAGVMALKATVGAPVYAPRAAVALKGAATARKAALQDKIATAKATAATGVAAKVADATAFKDEYVHNVGVAGRALGKVTGLSPLARAADPGLPDPANGTAADSAHAGKVTNGHDGPHGSQDGHGIVPPIPERDPIVVPTPRFTKKPPPPPAASAHSVIGTATATHAPVTPSTGSARKPPPPPPSPITVPVSGGARLRRRLRDSQGEP